MHTNRYIDTTSVQSKASVPHKRDLRAAAWLVNSLLRGDGGGGPVGHINLRASQRCMRDIEAIKDSARLPVPSGDCDSFRNH